MTNRNNTKKLAFTSGVFDLLHPGHVYFFKKARKLLPENTEFIVAIHSDKFVKKYKNKSRPIFTQEERKIVLESLEYIDKVIIWDGWESITELVFDLKPDFLVSTRDNLEKTDWDNDWHTVAEKIEAKLIGVEKTDTDYSTSHYIKKIKDG
jgi:cytidyltransferase-like protein